MDCCMGLDWLVISRGTCQGRHSPLSLLSTNTSAALRELEIRPPSIDRSGDGPDRPCLSLSGLLLSFYFTWTSIWDLEALGGSSVPQLPDGRRATWFPCQDIVTGLYDSWTFFSNVLLATKLCGTLVQVYGNAIVPSSPLPVWSHP